MHGRTPSMVPLLSSRPSHSPTPSTGSSIQPIGQQSFQYPGQTIGQQPFQQPFQLPGQPIGQQSFQPFLAQGGPSEARPLSHTHSATPSNLSYASPARSVSNASGSGGSEVNRTGSLTSIPEQRILHVTNASMDGLMYQDPLAASSSSAVGVASMVSSSHEPQLDGKGRMRQPSLGKAQLVHLDGGIVQEQLEAATTTARPVVEGGPAPPAYED